MVCYGISGVVNSSAQVLYQMGDFSIRLAGLESIYI